MSGRLIISGKKTYTPWNADNIERVLRDERIEKERVETEERLSRDKKNKMRIQSMKIRKYGNDDTGQGCQLHGASQAAKKSQHINLFQDEEKEMLKTAGLRRENKNDQTKRDNNVGIMPVYLCKRNKKEDEAASQTFYRRKDILRSDVDEKVKRSMDPMRRLHNHKEKDDNRRDASTIKTSRKKADHSDDESDAYSSSSSIVDRKRSSKRHSRKRHRRTKKRRRRHSETREHTSSQEHKISRAKTSSLEELRRRHNERSEQEALREKGIKDRATFSENFNLTRGTYINRKIRLNSDLVANFPNH